MRIARKRYGLGSVSLPLIALGLLFGASLFGVCLGDMFLQGIGLKAWSHGDMGVHYTVFYPLPLYILAFIFAQKNKNDFGAKAGRIISGILLVFLIAATPFMLVIGKG